MEPVEARDPLKPWLRSWAPEGMLRGEGGEIASSGNEVTGVPEGYGHGELAVWDLKAWTACWPAT